ncbi:MAG TPA: hypothetical protein VGQ73_03900, partial [Gemmatimonadales bacterium]|nr:hypothetical protein [Gemmatimonadales bacterium]
MRANPHSRAPLAPLAALAVALAISVCGCGSPEPQTGATSNPAASKALASEQSEVSIASLTFSQLNIDFDGDLHPQSEWGAATVQYVGADNTLYFNLAVNDVWRIQNIPLLSREGDGVLQSSNVNFDLGNTPGALVTTLQYAASLTTAPITQMPAGATAAAVGQQDYTIFTGLIGGTVPFTPPTPALVGGGGNGPKTTHSDGFPNQQAGKNECGPAAASNSLQWLKKKHNLAIPDAAITIAALKAALGWTPTGVPGN